MCTHKSKLYELKPFQYSIYLVSKGLKEKLQESLLLKIARVVIFFFSSLLFFSSARDDFSLNSTVMSSAVWRYLFEKRLSKYPLGQTWVSTLDYVVKQSMLIISTTDFWRSSRGLRESKGIKISLLSHHGPSYPGSPVHFSGEFSCVLFKKSHLIHSTYFGPL